MRARPRVATELRIPVKDLVEFVTKALVAQPDSVSVEEREQDGKRLLVVTVDQEDLGTVIGRRGRTVAAIRTLASAAAAKAGYEVEVELVD